MKASIIGSGSWGTALGELLIENGHDCLIYGRDQKQVDDINVNHRNSRYFPPDVSFDKTLQATTDLKKALDDRDVIVISVPSEAIRPVLNQIQPLLKNKPIFVNTAKGFDVTTDKRLSEVYREIIGKKMNALVSLIGPSLSVEVARRQLTCICAVSLDHEAAAAIAQNFSNHYFRVYTSSDEIGAEIGVAMKNPIAICSGILKGLGYGDNARAALMTRGLHEMVHFGVHFGGRPETYLGLTGLGDLDVTTSSLESRNFRAGLEIGKVDGMQTFDEQFDGVTVEGVLATKLIHDIAEKNHLEVPIIDALYSVLYEKAKPSQMALSLMNRPLKGEND
jgi:glycerol-3-phosphate dehydrogenase (NAD(P)+)